MFEVNLAGLIGILVGAGVIANVVSFWLFVLFVSIFGNKRKIRGLVSLYDLDSSRQSDGTCTVTMKAERGWKD